MNNTREFKPGIQQEIDSIVESKMSMEIFATRAKAEAQVIGKKVVEEIRAILKKYDASFVVYARELYVVPSGCRVYSEWNFPSGVIIEPTKADITVMPYTNEYRIVRPFPDDLATARETE